MQELISKACYTIHCIVCLACKRLIDIQAVCRATAADWSPVISDGWYQRFAVLSTRYRRDTVTHVYRLTIYVLQRCAESIIIIISSWVLDYVNSILLGCPQKHIARLQRAQNALARAVVQPQSRALPLSSSSHLLKQLHWLPINWRIRFKLSTLTFKALHTGLPKYLTDLLHPHKPTIVHALSVHSNVNSSTSQPFLWLTRLLYYCNEKLEHFTTWSSPVTLLVHI